MPPTPKTPKKVLFDESSETSNDPKYYSQPISRAATYVEGAQTQNQDSGQQARYPHLERLKDTRFDSFKTWSGKLERQISHIRGKPVEPQPEQRPKNLVEGDALPVDRYFDALDGPELDTLRVSIFYLALYDILDFSHQYKLLVEILEYYKLIDG